MTFFLNSHLGLSRLLRSNENRGWIFEAATSNFCNHSWNFGSSPRNGKVDLCTTNGSIVLIYLTFLYFIFYCTLVSNAKGNLAKSNKSELWNRCRTEVYLTILRWGEKVSGMIAKFRGRSLKNSTSIFIRPQRPRKAQLRIQKKCHGIIPFFPYILKIALVFCTICFGLGWTCRW